MLTKVNNEKEVASFQTIAFCVLLTLVILGVCPSSSLKSSLHFNLLTRILTTSDMRVFHGKISHPLYHPRQDVCSNNIPIWQLVFVVVGSDMGFYSLWEWTLFSAMCGRFICFAAYLCILFATLLLNNLRLSEKLQKQTVSVNIPPYLLFNTFSLCFCLSCGHLVILFAYFSRQTLAM